MKTLFLGEFQGHSQAEILSHMANQFQVPLSTFDGHRVIAGYMESGGYDGKAWILIEKEGQLYENYSSHCSCYGHEDQWNPEKTDIRYLKSDKFSSNADEPDATLIKEFLKNY